MNKRIQKEIWQKEHLTNETLPSLAQMLPSDNVVNFVEYLKEKQFISPYMKVIDIGCGKGRNSIYLAQQNLCVYAVDFIEHAINHAQKHAKSKNLTDKIHFSIANIDDKWLFDDNFFDIAIDCFSSIDIETENGRKIYKSEMLRTLKPGGYALVCVVSINDEWEKELIKNHPGPEKNSSIWPQNRKFQKNYDEKELRSFYKEFEIIKLNEVSKKAFKLNKEFIATNFWVVLRKS